MGSRMDRYKDIETNTDGYSRSNKNRELYQNIGSNTKYTNFTDVREVNAVSLDDAKRNYRTREGYQTIKEYGDVKPKLQKELDDFNYIYKDHENRVYDINSVLEEAKANRKKIDDMEAKRKLKNTNYNILASLDKGQLEKYKKEKVERAKPDKEEFRGIIDTITSKTLAGEISKETGVDLLSDLMATSVMDKVEPSKEMPKQEKEEEKPKTIDDEVKELIDGQLDKEKLEEIKKKKNEVDTKDPTNDIMKDIDKSFYTKSMDLSDKDFVFDEMDDRKVPVIIKILLVLILLALIAVGVFFIIKKI